MHRVLILLVAACAALSVGTGARADMRGPDDRLAGGREQEADARVHEDDGESRGAGQWLIAVYQNAIGPSKGSRCPMIPSCSEYARQAIARHGVVRGVLAAGDRLHRCGHDLQYYPPLRTNLGIYFEDEP